MSDMTAPRGKTGLLEFKPAQHAAAGKNHRRDRLVAGKSVRQLA